MNCAECRDNLVARAEGLLAPEEQLRCDAHLEYCVECRTNYAAVAKLQQRLTVRGRTAADVAIVAPVMQRVLVSHKEPENFMKRIFSHRWGFGLGAAAAAIALVLFGILSTPRAHARPEDVMARGANAVGKLATIHLRGQLRAYPQDNFGSINADTPFCTIELWKQFDPDLKWRVEKPRRVVVMDGQSTVMLINGNIGTKLPRPSGSAFDTDWLQRIANLSNAITNELKNAAAKGWQLSLDETNGADGRAKSVVTILAKSGVPDDDYIKNTFYENADTRRVYRFDDETELLEAVQVYLVRPAGEVEIFDLEQIDCNQPIDTNVWNLQIPADVSWAQLSDQIQKLPDNDKYTSMTAEQAARAFFEACASSNWDEAGKFMSPINDQVKKGLGGLEIISVGDSFTSKAYGGKFVPYEIKLGPMEFNLRVSNSNAANRYVITGVFDSNLKLMQDLTWSNEPAILPDNSAYAALSPAQAVKAYADAQAKLDWNEMQKFDPDYDVQNDKAQAEAVVKMGADIRNAMPVFEPGEAFWSAERSAWFVKCRVTQVKKWNMALRNDNPAHRWQVDGGL